MVDTTTTIGASMPRGDIDAIVRQRILDSVYWKVNCYTLNAALLCDKAADLRAVGGLFGNQQPTPYVCLVYKLLLIAPPREIIDEMLGQPHFKYLTAVAALYVRLTYDPLTVHRLLEPLLADYRKLRLQLRDRVVLWHIDELADALLTEERVFGLALPRMPSRLKLEDVGLEPRPAVDLD